MNEIEIPQHQWQEFGRSFSRQHRDWLVTVDVAVASRPEPPSQEEHAGILVSEQPLKGLAVEQREGATELWISAGEEHSHLAHRIPNPEHLWFEEAEDGLHAGLRVAAAGQITRLRFRAAARPEELDGLP